MVNHVIGLVLLCTALGTTTYGLRALRRALLPGWDGPAGLLADTVAVLASIVVITQILGLLAVYRAATLLVAHVLVGVGARHIAGRFPRPESPAGATAAADRLGRIWDRAAAIGTAVALGPWVVRTAAAFTDGVPGADTNWYHLPQAAKLVQTGSLREIHHFDGGGLTAYFPIASTFFHSIGMAFLGSDMLSPLVNLGWAALALLACWVVGRPFGISSATLLGGAAALSFPGLVGHNGGSAMNDIVVVALLTSAVALLVNADHTRITANLPVICLAALATGTALGTKWTAIPATGALTASVLLFAPTGRRLLVGATWLLASGATGLLTYVRNLIIVGNPLPPRDLHLGPIHFDAVRDEPGVASVASWLGDETARDQVFVPGLELWFGPHWWMVLLVTGAGLLLGLFRGPGWTVRIAALTGTVAVAGYLFMPQALEVFGLPNYFVSNLRYGSPAMILAFPVLAMSHDTRGSRPPSAARSV